MLLSAGAAGTTAAFFKAAQPAEASGMQDDADDSKTVAHLSLSEASEQDYSPEDGQFPGLVQGNAYLWAIVDTEDGKRYNLNRSMNKHSAMYASIVEASPDVFKFPTNILRQPGLSDVYSGEARWVTKDRVTTLVPSDAGMLAKHPIAMQFGPNRYVWQEDGIADLVLTPVPRNVVRFVIPAASHDEGYTSSGCAVSGAINGVKVSGGYGGLDRMYAPPGLPPQQTATGALEHYWIVWGALMPDGSWQTGNVWLGDGRFATALFNRPGEPPVIATNEAVANTVAWETKGGLSLPTSATFGFGGRTFRWEARYNAAPAGPTARAYHVFGVVQEDGGPRPVNSWSTMEMITARARPRP
jgi:hypothetical protein